MEQRREILLRPPDGAGGGPTLMRSASARTAFTKDPPARPITNFKRLKINYIFIFANTSLARSSDIRKLYQPQRARAPPSGQCSPPPPKLSLPSPDAAAPPPGGRRRSGRRRRYGGSLRAPPARTPAIRPWKTSLNFFLSLGLSRTCFSLRRAG